MRNYSVALFFNHSTDSHRVLVSFKKYYSPSYFVTQEISTIFTKNF